MASPSPRDTTKRLLLIFVRARLPNNPTLGDRISFGSVGLVIGRMNGKRITRIGLDLEPASAAYVHERKLVTVRDI